MAARFNKTTLEGNWFEEQSSYPKLNGVVANYGQNDYSTTSKTTMGAPQKHRQYRPDQKNTIHRLITAEYIEQIALMRASNNSPVGSFIYEPPSLAASKPYATANSNAFGKRRKTTNFQKKQFASNQMGAFSIPRERARVPRGAVGESYRESSDPQFCTAAQRSWAYGVNTKPTIAKKTRVHNPKTSLPGFSTAPLPTHGRRSKAFTDKKPRGIFNE